MNVTTYRPLQKAAWRPALRGKRAVQVGQAGIEKLGVAGVLAPVIGIGLAGSAAYLGIRAGLRETGATQWIGWIVGLTGLIAVVTTVGDLFYLGGLPRSEVNAQASNGITIPGAVQP